MSHDENGAANGDGNGRLDEKLSRELYDILEDWLFLVGDGADVGPLAQCTEYGLNVDHWNRPGIERGLRGKNVILVFHSQAEEGKEEFEAFRRVGTAGAAKTKIWKPLGFGTYEAPNLKALHKRHNLGELLYWAKPWESDIGLKNPNRKPGWHLTDMGNAERMASRYGPVLKHCRPWKKWLVWNGQLWQNDELGKIDAMAKMTIQRIIDECEAENDLDQREKIAKWALKSEATAKIEAMLKQVRSEPRIPILPRDLDPDPWLLNVQNGTINLKTGNLQPHDRNDMITRMAPVEYDIDAKSALVQSFLDEIFPDKGLAGFVQRVCGMGLTGDVSEQILPIFWGSGANGKSTLLGAMLGMLGSDYAMMAPPGLLFMKPGSQHPTALADLFRMRFVVDMESAEETQFNEALVKQLTGSDPIKARRMREDYWGFDPTHTLVLGTNHKPIIKETKNAIWRRVKLIPFTVEIPEAQQVKDLGEQLKAEYTALLAWAVQGCLDWQKNGLQTPQVIADATAEYRVDMDALAIFFEEECDLGQYCKCKATDLYRAYRKHAERRGEQPPTQTAFGRWMTDRGFKKDKSDVIWYQGIELRRKPIEDLDRPY